MSSVSYAGVCSIATITYIFDGGVLVNFALQVLEDALSEKSVGRHDGRLCLVWNVLFGIGVVNVLKEESSQTMVVLNEFARRRGEIRWKRWFQYSKNTICKLDN